MSKRNNISVARDIEAIATLISSGTLGQKQADSALRSLARGLRETVKPQFIGFAADPFAGYPSMGVDLGKEGDKVSFSSVPQRRDSYIEQLFADAGISQFIAKNLGDKRAENKAAAVDQYGAYANPASNQVEIMYGICREHGPEEVTVIVNGRTHQFTRSIEGVRSPQNPLAAGPSETVEAFNKRIHAHFSRNLSLANFVAEQIAFAMKNSPVPL